MAKKPAKSTKNKLFTEVIETAVEFHKRRLWTSVDSDDPISVIVEGEEHPVLAMVLGSEGMQIGLAVLCGEQAIDGFENVILAGGHFDRNTPCEMLMLAFEMPSEVSAEYLRPIEQSGRVFGRSSAAPIFTSQPPGELSRPASRPELRIILAVMRTLLTAASGGKIHQRPWDDRRRTLELTLEGKGKKAIAVDTVRTWPAPSVTRPPATPIPSQRWREVTSTARQTQAIWCIALMPAPPIEGDGAPVPQEIMLTLDRGAASMLAPQIIEASHPGALLDAFLDLVESGNLKGTEDPGLPKELRFTTPRPVEQLRSIMEEVGITVTFAPNQPELMGAVKSLTDLVQESMESDGLLGKGATPQPPAPNPAPHLDPREPIGPWKDADSSLSSRLIEAGAAKGAALKPRPLKRYFSDEDLAIEAMENEANPIPGLAYFNWFCFRYRSRKDARTVAERLRQKSKLPPAEELLLDARIDAKLIFCRIIALDPGASIEVENVVNGDTHRIHDIGLSQSAREGIGLFLEIYPVKEWTFTSLAGPMIAPTQIAHTLEQLETIGIEFKDGYVVGDQTNLGVLCLLPPPPPPTLQNTDGEDLERLTVSFTLPAPTTLNSVLKPLPDLQDNEDGTWTWVVDGKDKPGFENGVVMAHFEQIGDQLLATVNSAPRALRVKSLLKSTQATFLSIAATPEPEGGHPQPGLPPQASEDLRAHLEEVIHNQAMAWLDKPHPDLQGQSPRAALWSDPTLAKKVERLIRTFPDAGSPQGPIRAPREEMLRALGLD